VTHRTGLRVTLPTHRVILRNGLNRRYQHKPSFRWGAPFDRARRSAGEADQVESRQSG